MKKLQAVLIVGVAAGALMAASAQAAPLLNYEATTQDGNIVTGTALFEFLDNPTPPPDVFLNLTVSNTSTDNSMITGLGFDLPDGSDFKFSFEDTNGWVLTGAKGGPMSGFSVCIATDKNCTGGNPNNGIEAGETFIFGFSFNSSLTASQMEALTVTGYNDGILLSTARFQRVGLDGEDSAFAPGTPGAPVPEPATLGMLGLGMMGLAALRRRKLGLKI